MRRKSGSSDGEKRGNAFVHSATVLVCGDALGGDPILRAAFDQAGIGDVTTISDPGLALLSLLHQASGQMPRQPMLVIVPALAELRHRALTLGATDCLSRLFNTEALMIGARNTLHLRAVDYLVGQAGHGFDPELMARFIAQLFSVEAVLADYPDTH